MSVANPLKQTGNLKQGCWKRKGSEEEDDNVDAKVKKARYWYILESESPQPTSSDEEESIYSVQEHETEYARDTSDTSSHTSWATSSDDVMRVEYEVASLSGNENPFIDFLTSSDPEQDIIIGGAIAAALCDEDVGLADDSDDSITSWDSEISRADYWTCVQCNNSNNNPKFRYCEKCYQIRKHFFPPRPKGKRRRKASKKKLKLARGIDGQEPLATLDSGLGSSLGSQSTLLLNLKRIGLEKSSSFGEAGQSSNFGQLEKFSSSGQLEQSSSSGELGQSTSFEKTEKSSNYGELGKSSSSGNLEQSLTSGLLKKFSSSQSNGETEISRNKGQSTNYGKNEQSMNSAENEQSSSETMSYSQESVDTGFSSSFSQQCTNYLSQPGTSSSQEYPALMTKKANCTNDDQMENGEPKFGSQESQDSLATTVSVDEKTFDDSENSENAELFERIESEKREKLQNESDKLCITCLIQPKTSAFVHGRCAHLCCCYRCAMKAWKTTKRCPMCNRKVTNVLRIW